LIKLPVVKAPGAFAPLFHFAVIFLRRCCQPVSAARKIMFRMANPYKTVMEKRYYRKRNKENWTWELRVNIRNSVWDFLRFQPG
jgi:hypothetical protein